MKSKIRNAYNKLGKFYYESRKYGTGASYFYNEHLEMPTTLKMLGNVNGKKILDLGCGPGLYARILSNKGARVKGIDISKEEIKIAKREDPKSEFIVGDIEKLPFKNNEFDIVLSALVLGHLKSWNKTLRGVNKVLKKGGIFVFSINNPISECAKKVKWKGRKFRVIKDYFKEKWVIEDWTDKKDAHAEGAHYHKTYETIINLLIKNGFEIIGYKDAKPSIKIKKLFPKQYTDTINRPRFCTWKVRKK